MASGTYDTPTGRASFLDDILVEEWDDATRTYTDHRTGESRPYTEEENAEADSNIESESRLDDLEARIAALEKIAFPSPPDPTTPDDPTVPTWDDLAGVWPHGGLVRDGGTVYRNVSGVPLTTPPSGFPGAPSRWSHLFVKVTTGTTSPDPDPAHPAGYVGPWSAQTTYKIGDVCDRAGRYYRCKVAHGPEYQGTWGPPQASVWDDIGTVTTAQTARASSKGNPRK